MPPMDNRFRISPPYALLLAGALLVLAGCRTYGGEYDNTEKLYEQLLIAEEQLEASLARAERNLALLEQAAAQDSLLEEYVAYFAAVMEEHEALREEMADEIADVGGDPDDYRDLHRTYGAAISEQRTIQVIYADIIYAVASRGDRTADSAQVAAERFTPASYAAVPPYYERVRNQARALTMQQALRRALAGQPTTPADTTEEGALPTAPADPIR